MRRATEEDPIRAEAQRRDRREAQESLVRIKVLVPSKLRDEFRRLAVEDGLSMNRILMILIQGYIERHPAALGMIEQQRREGARPTKPSKPPREMFSQGELREIWEEIGKREDGDV